MMTQANCVDVDEIIPGISQDDKNVGELRIYASRRVMDGESAVCE